MIDLMLFISAGIVVIGTLNAKGLYKKAIALYRLRFIVACVLAIIGYILGGSDATNGMLIAVGICWFGAVTQILYATVKLVVDHRSIRKQLPG